MYPSRTVCFMIVWVLIQFFHIDVRAQQLDAPQLEGKWKLISYEAIDAIRDSPQYKALPQTQKEELDLRLEEQLNNTIYIFDGKDQMQYTSFEGKKMLNREANYKVVGDRLIITDAKNQSNREALIHSLKDDVLILIPMKKDSLGSEKMIFHKQ
jgi:hypothetical protein